MLVQQKPTNVDSWIRPCRTEWLVSGRFSSDKGDGYVHTSLTGQVLVAFTNAIEVLAQALTRYKGIRA